jgi:hypothetical protein
LSNGQILLKICRLESRIKTVFLKCNLNGTNKLILKLRSFALVVCILLTANYTTAQINFEDFQIEIKKTNEPILIDGILDENTWKEASVGKDFFMITPIDTGKATQFSEARVAFDDEFLYISIIFFNNAVQGDYVVESLQRDFSFGKNDNFLVALDPFDNQSTGFAFGLNAYGAQWDGTMYNGRNVDLNWDTKWYSEVKFDRDQWVCEIAIPFKSIRYEEGNRRWGLISADSILKQAKSRAGLLCQDSFPPFLLRMQGLLFGIPLHLPREVIYRLSPICQTMPLKQIRTILTTHLNWVEI